jgi:cell division protein FtsX
MVIAKQNRIAVTVTLALTLSGCGLLSDGASDDDSAATEVAEAGLTDARTTPEDITALGDALEDCRSTATVLEGMVWLELDVQADEVAGLDEFLTTSPLVSSSRYIDTQETYEDFQEYFADDPEILELVTPEILPTSFELTFEEEADTAAMITEIEAFGFVDDVELNPDDSVCLPQAAALRAACNQPPSELTVWLRPQVGQTTVDAVAAALADLPQVTEARYVDLDEAVAEFEAYWADDQEVLDLVDRESLPTSFTVTLTDEVQASKDWEGEIASVRRALIEIDGVEDAEAKPTEISEACWRATDGGAVAQILEDAN